MMNNKNKKQELGREIQTQRQSKGLSVAQLAENTKIAAKNIENIENGIFDFLPGAYVKAYLSAIASELGFDAQVVLRKYQASFVKDVDLSQYEEFEEKKPAKQTKTVIFEKPDIIEKPKFVVPVVTTDAPVVDKKAETPEKTPPVIENIKEPVPETPPMPEKEELPVIEEKPEPVHKTKGKKGAHKPEIKAPEPLPSIEEEKPVIEPIPEPPAAIKPLEPIIAKPPKTSWFEEFMLIVQFYSVFIFGGLFVIVLLIVLLFMLPRSAKDKEAPKPVIAAADTTAADTLSSAPDSLLAPVLLEELLLTVHIKDTTWIKIVYNDSLTDEAIFTPGSVKSWKGYEKFYLRIGNASGVTVSLDDKDLGVAGQAGRITNIMINKDGIHKIQKPEFPKAMGVSSTQ